MSGPGDQLTELFSGEVPWVQYILQNAKLIIERKEFLFFHFTHLLRSFSTVEVADYQRVDVLGNALHQVGHH